MGYTQSNTLLPKKEMGVYDMYIEDLMRQIKELEKRVAALEKLTVIGKRDYKTRKNTSNDEYWRVPGVPYKVKKEEIYGGDN